MNWTLLTILSLVALAQCQEICLSAEEDPYLLFGLKTSYIFANKGGLPNTRVQDVVGCSPKAIWLMSRHGSHNPEANETAGLLALTDLRNNIVTNYRNGNFRNTNQRICMSDLNLLERWSWSQNPAFAGDLTSDGYISTQQLAQAWKQRYPGLLTNNPHDYLFKYGGDLRSRTSFRAFIEGVFKTQPVANDIPKENDENILKPYMFCPAWKREVGDNNDTLKQRNVFESKQEYRDMISNISKRLGFNYDVQKQFVDSMLLMCSYDKAWNVAQISPWCSVFSKEDLQRLEFAEDLETYYKYGHGSPLNERIGCTSVKDMMDFFKKHVGTDTPQQPRVQVQLTDAGTLLTALTALGRGHGTPPTGDNYHTQAARARTWRTSLLAPFNANIAAVLYRCQKDGNFQINDDYQVLFLENEKPMNIEGCRVGLCDWSFVQNKFGPMADKCNLEFCNNAANVKSYAAPALTLIALLVSFLRFD